MSSTSSEVIAVPNCFDQVHQVRRRFLFEKILKLCIFMLNLHEFIIGGVAAALASIFTNPLEVIKTRKQLQGELLAKGKYPVYYSNVLHAFYSIVKIEGLLSLQKGLTTAVYYQFSMNSIRLGVFQCIENFGLTRDDKGNTIKYRTFFAAAFAGCFGAFIGSPFFMIKTHLQTKSDSPIGVGYQYPYSSFNQAVVNIFRTQGISGLWRGSSAAILRLTFGSAIQLTTFSILQNILNDHKLLESESFINTSASAFIGGISLTLAITPIDVISIRLYNQPINPLTKKGLNYDGIFNCFCKIIRSEGPLGLYKGATASFLRFVPHTLLTFLFWRELRKLYFNFELKKENKNFS